MQKGDLTMAAKMVFVIAALMLVIIGLSAAEIPDLIGNWSGSYKGYEKSMGYLEENKTGALNMTVSEQQGRCFAGNFSDVEQWREGFSGIIALDNKTLYIAEYDKGYAIGTILSNDDIELAYIEDGIAAGAFIDEIHRVK
jgi:hypothetical protein